MSRYHFVAIGGAVMHNLALELHALGHHVSGSDDEIFDPAKSRLFNQGLLPESFGWNADKIHSGIDAVILGMHARIDNPELLKAQELGLPVFSFPEFIYKHAQQKTRVVIAGSHGKTTCTAMLMHILKSNHQDFDYLVGSLIDGYDRMVKLSQAPLMVLEGDEYLSSPIDLQSKFLHYHPQWAMITGIAWDHINVFPTIELYEGSFQKFLTQVSDAVIYYAGDPRLHEWCSTEPKNIAYRAPAFEFSAQGTQVHLNEASSFLVPFFGKHNIENAAGVVELAFLLGISREQAWKSLETFPGTAKRLECLKRSEEETVYRDFAHAPSKVKATVQAVRTQYSDASLLAVLELHTYSSLDPAFMTSYKGLLDSAQESWVLYDPHVFKLKKMQVPEISVLQENLGKVKIFDCVDDLSKAYKQWQNSQTHQSKVSLWMSSGNFGGLKIV